MIEWKAGIESDFLRTDRPADKWGGKAGIAYIEKGV